MFIQLSNWETVRDRFTDDEKEELTAAVTGESVCPQGRFVNEAKLPSKLRTKLLVILPATTRRAAG